MDIRKAIALVMIATGLVIAPFVALAAVDSDWEVSDWFDDDDHHWHEDRNIRFSSDWHDGDFDFDGLDFDGLDLEDLDIDVHWDDDFGLEVNWQGDVDHPWDSNGTWQSDNGDWKIEWEDGSVNIDFSGDTDD